uniref:Uncharacterized protein n=1 Tax=Nelumbo nucifera TaxID=4432 RepID=A0A822YDW3_NELNU|nr:TPA_asm: hypothetical protein HUJ06_009184 [Nelumbo nucifera]
MAPLTIAFAPPVGRVFAATTAKRSGGCGEEKGLLDWILRGLQKEDQLLETDPTLKNVKKKNNDTTSSGWRGSIAVPPKKSSGFGGKRKGERKRGGRWRVKLDLKKYISRANEF